MHLQLSLGITANPRTNAGHRRKIKPDGIDFLPTVLHPSELFWRQLRFSEFDVSEMSVSSLMMGGGERRYPFRRHSGLHTRKFFHTTTLVRPRRQDRHARRPQGKRVGVPNTSRPRRCGRAACWQHEFGVHPKDMEFLDGAVRPRAATAAHRLPAAPGVTVKPHPRRQEHRLDDAVGRARRGDLLPGRSQLIDRSTADLHGHPQIKPLFPDPWAEGVRFFRKTSLYPINHAW